MTGSVERICSHMLEMVLFSVTVGLVRVTLVLSLSRSLSLYVDSLCLNTTGFCNKCIFFYALPPATCLYKQTLVCLSRAVFVSVALFVLKLCGDGSVRGGGEGLVFFSFFFLSL